MSWISVKDRLPVNNKPVLVFVESPTKRSKTLHAHYTSRLSLIKIDTYDHKSTLGPGWSRIDNITHWQPLPQPPLQ